MAHALDPAIWTAAAIEAEAQVMLARAVPIFEAARGETLATTDGRYALILRGCRALAAQRAYIARARAVALLRFVGGTDIEAAAKLYDEGLTGAVASSITVRFTWSPAGPFTIEGGKRVTDGTHVWAVNFTVNVIAGGATYADVACTCTETGAASNDVAAGAVDTLVDDIPGIVSVSNLADSAGGSDGETTEEFRERLRDALEYVSPAGGRAAYAKLAKDVSVSVLDAVAIGPDDATFTARAALAPGVVQVLITDVSTITPSAGLMVQVNALILASGQIPESDLSGFSINQPSIVEFDAAGFYYIHQDDADREDEIKTAVEAAIDDYLDWQQAKIGRDVNPDELTRRIIAAGAHRVALTDPAFAELLRDEQAQLNYNGLEYGGLEDDGD